jgi:hypothetical protein
VQVFLRLADPAFFVLEVRLLQVVVLLPVLLAVLLPVLFVILMPVIFLLRKETLRSDVPGAVLVVLGCCVSGGLLGRGRPFAVSHELEVVLFLKQLVVLLGSVAAQNGAREGLSTDAGNQKFALDFVGKLGLHSMLAGAVPHIQILIKLKL